ncbi:uncharacterized protein NPIL_88921 [Nephila pilipes]|uniref:Uncharacterized protein n=1 Tax=Nephila pilipes TaxID=299642 RepID=A0A8X6QL46_NEPPI|nr:uncharacterized protein NPIL_88921 [Nephila pilipes]
MACVYWLEEEAKQLWEEMPETCRSHLEFINRVDSLSPGWVHAVKDWITFLRSGVVDWRNHPFSHPFSWYCLDSIVIQGNLLKHLSPQERLEVFQRMMTKYIPLQTRIFCLSKMSAEHFEVVIKKEPVHVLKGLCNWPFHRQFQEMTDRILSLLTKKEFREFLLNVICDKIAWDWMDCDYVELLNELWNKSPVHFKQHVESSEFFDILKKALNHDYKKPFEDQCPWENIFKIEKIIS